MFVSLIILPSLISCEKDKETGIPEQQKFELTDDLIESDKDFIAMKNALQKGTSLVKNALQTKGFFLSDYKNPLSG